MDRSMASLPIRVSTSPSPRQAVANANASPSASPPPEDEPADAADIPLTMAASVVLSDLPADAHDALDKVDDMKGKKVAIRFVPLGSAPTLQSNVFKVAATNRFETVVTFLRKKLQVRPDESVICYINDVFAPGLDEGVGGLWRCFKQGFEGKEQMVVRYSLTPAFG